MGKLLTFFTLLFTFLSHPVLSCDEHGTTGIVEDNDLWIAEGDNFAGGLTKDQFLKVIDRAEKIYKPIIKAKGGNLNIKRLWSDGTVNASAQQQGSSWIVNMYGGLARHETITEDGFAMVLCHEIGHHIGGMPKKRLLWMTMWASNEGQSDYFGSLKCMRKVLATEDNISYVENNLDVPSYVSDLCDENFADPEESAICQRSSMAGYSLGELFRVLKKLDKKIDFQTPSQKKVSSTDHNHPAPQCRLDTYFAGALCPKDVGVDVSSTDPKQGTCNRGQEQAIMTRPLCWWKPKNSDGGGTDTPEMPDPGEGLPLPFPFPMPTPTPAPPVASL